MSFVWLNDLRRTTSVRLALSFLALFASASLIVFGLVYWETAGFLARDVDAGLTRETRLRAGKSRDELARLFDERAPLDPEGMRPFALFDRDGRWLAGNAAAAAAAVRPAVRLHAAARGPGGVVPRLAAPADDRRAVPGRPGHEPDPALPVSVGDRDDFRRAGGSRGRPERRADHGGGGARPAQSGDPGDRAHRQRQS